MDKLPLLSVCMITYGHENYILQAIESVLMQQTNFNYEFIIVNDSSTDKTDDIIQKLLDTHEKAQLIKYFKHDKNIGMYANFIYALDICKGKYIALCDGDDFWTDPLKLQKQIDFLESNIDYEVCFTNINIINSTGKLIKEKLINDGRKSIYVRKDLPIWAPTLTRVFRNRDFKNNLISAPGLDTLMLLYQSKFGKIKFINEVTATYRLHEEGVYSSKSVAKKKEHIILTDIVSLQFVEQPLFAKYFGMIFKKLVELKPLDYQLYIKNKKLFQIEYRKYRTSFSFLMRLKCKISFFLLSLPIIKQSNLVTKYLLKILNRFFIYS